jgi:hypothetical protein
VDPLPLGAVEGDIWLQYDQSNKMLRLVSGVWTVTGTPENPSPFIVPGVDQCAYEGHSLRQHSGGFMGDANTKYPGLIALCNAPSHLGNPASTVSPRVRGGYDPAVFGSEELMRIGTSMFEREKWYCLESYLKMNSIDLSAPDPNGNGRAINDGILRYWIDGVMVGEKTDLAWRLHPDMGIEGTWFLMFHGGRDDGTDNPVTGAPAVYPDHEMHYRLNHYVCAKQYIGPHPTRRYPPTVDPPSDPPVTNGDLTAFATAINLAGTAPNTWIDTPIVPGKCWAVKSMVDGGRYCTQAEVEPGPSDKGNFNAVAQDALVNSNGAAWFPTKKQFFWRGGGHGGWMGGEWYWMDVPTMKMGRMTNPPSMVRNPASTSGYGWLNTDGSPTSYHTFNSIVAVEALDCFFSIESTAWPDGGFNNTNLWKYHIPTKTVTLAKANSLGTLDNVDKSPHALWVPAYQKIALGIPNSWRWYDPFADTLGTLRGGHISYAGGNSVATPTGIYSFHGGTSAGETNFGKGFFCLYISYANIGVADPTSVASSVPRIWAHPRRVNALAPYNSYFWDSIRNMVISWSGSHNSEAGNGYIDVGRIVYAIDFANDHLYEFVTTGDWAKSQSFGSFTKWQHLTDIDCYIGVNNRMRGDTGNSNGWLLLKPGILTRLT